MLLSDAANQTPLFEGLNLLKTDLVLQQAILRDASGVVTRGDAVWQSLDRIGVFAGSKEAADLARLSNDNPPRLKILDARGNRHDIVEFHPAYHSLMQRSMSERLHFSAWAMTGEGQVTTAPVSNVLRCAGSYLMTQAEAGHGCPITMTNAAIPALMIDAKLAGEWLPKIFSTTYDPDLKPAAQKASVTFGMGMTERQGGTDVRANTTHAEPIGQRGSGEAYLINGHKWFMSAPMSDAFLVLAQAEGGLSCFVLPRVLADGTRNGLHFQHLKDKLGNRSNASSEVAFENATAFLLGDEGRGIAAIMEMVTATRLDCAIASAALMRNALARAAYHARHRTVFQKKLIDQPLMQHVLADMFLDVEAATVLSFRLARSFDNRAEPIEAAWRRIMTPVTKYWSCKLVPAVANEAMECLGGNGYVEDWTMARLYREAPLNAIWEGSGNVMALDMLRAMQKEGDAVACLFDHFSHETQSDTRLRKAFDEVRAIFTDPSQLEMRGREAIEKLARLAAATILIKHASAAVSDAFIATRLMGGHRDTYGQGLQRADTRAIVASIFADAS